MKINEKTIKKILVGIDFSEASKCALNEAVRLADQQSGEIHALHIIEEGMMDAIEAFSHLDRDEIYNSITERLDAFCRECRVGTSNLTKTVKIGQPVDEFKELCDTLEPNLVVLGAWGSQSHQDKTTGTTAKQIVSGCQGDVLLVRPRPDTNLSKVAACIDFSEYDVSIVRAADQLCVAEDATLEILHVFFPPWEKSSLEHQEEKVVSRDFICEYKAVLQGRLDALIPLNVHGVASFKSKTTVIEDLKHSESILSHLKRTEADVAVIGARGQSRIDSMILGRIAERIVTESPCSVYIVKDLK